MKKEEKEEMEIISFRAPKSLKLWIKEKAKEENMAYTTMARVMLDRMKYTDEMIKQIYENDKKKRGI